MNELKRSTSFELSQAVTDGLNEFVPVEERSQFVDRAIADALLKQARQAALEAIQSLTPIDTKGQDSVETLRQIRAARARYSADRHQGSPA